MSAGMRRVAALALLALVVGLALSASEIGAQDLRVQYGDRVTGEIATGSAPDVWRFDGGAGDRVTVRLERIDGNLVPALTVRDPAGELALDVAWLGSDEPVSEATLRLASGGEHAIEVRAGQGAGTYALSLILARPGSAAGRADIALSYGQTVEGELADTAAVDAWSFRGEAGDVIDAVLTPLEGETRPRVALISPTGTTVATGTTLSAVRLPMGGTYTLDVRLADGVAGAYRLALRLRNSATVDTGFLAAPLELGVPVGGRLTSDAPTALYRITGSGTLALALDLADANARADIAVLTENRAVLNTLSGFGQVRAPIALGAQGSVLVEITSPDVTPNSPVEFALHTGALRRAGRNARPLIPGRQQRIAPGAEPVVWFLDARAGDVIELAVTPDVFSPDAQVQVYNPQGDVMLLRRVDAGFRQPLLFAQGGLYEIAIQAGGQGYTLGAEQIGAEGVPFDLVLDRVERGPLAANGALAVTSEVASRADEVWTLDISEVGTWAFDLAASGEGLLALRVESPDGALIAQGVTQPLSRQASLEARVEMPGRYRIAVLNPAEGALGYTLRATPAGGGELTPGETGRGVLLAARPEHRWTVDVLAPAHLRVELRALAGGDLPDTALVGPDGMIVPLTPVSPANPGTLVAQVSQSGTYTLRLSLPESLTSLSYRVGITVESAQNAPAPVVESASLEPLIAAPTPAPALIRVNPLAQILPATRPGPDVLANAPLLTIDGTVRGTISQNAHYQVWRFQALSGQQITLAAVGLAQGAAPDLTLLDEQGEVLARSLAPDRTSNRLSHRFAADGRYFVVVRYVPGGRYLLRTQDRSALDDTLSAVMPGRVIAVGETVRGELLDPDTVEHVYFYAHTGDALQAQVIRPAGSGGVSLRLERVNNAVLVEGQADPARAERTTLSFTTATEGVYRLAVQPVADGFVPGEFALHLALTGSPALTRDGLRLESEGFGALASDDLTDTWLFAAAAGERVTIAVEAGSGGPQPLVVELADTAGTPFLRQESIVGAPAITLDRVSLPRTGVYRLIVGAARGESGPYRVRLVRDTSYLSDAQHALPLNQTVSRVLTGDNTLDVWTFSGSQGDVISAEARAIRGDAGLLSFQVRTQNGTVLTSVAGDATGRAAAPQILLPETGHYTLAIGNLSPEFEGALAYELTVLLESTQARSMGALLPPDGRGAGTLGGADLRDVWLFEGQQGDVARITLTAEGGGVAASVLTTDWHIASTSGRPSMLAVGDQDGPGTLELEPVVLPADGVYTIDVTAPPGGTTDYTVSLTLDSVSALSTVPVDPPGQVEGRISEVAFREAWTFTAQQGDAVSLRVVPDSRATLAPHLTLYAPDGHALVRVESASGEEARLDVYRLPESGVYTVAVSRRLGATGGTEGRFRLEIALDPAPNIATRLLRYGQIGRSWINNTAPLEHWIFEGEEGDVIEARLEVLSGTLDPLLRLYGPDDALIAASEQGDDGLPLIRHRLTVAGSYRIEVERRGGAFGPTQGNYALALNRLYRFASLPGTARTIAYGQRVTGAVDDETPLERWTFAGAAGDQVQAAVRFPADDAALTLNVADPSGALLADGRRGNGRTTIDGLTLPYSGVYVLEVRRSADARTPYSPYELELALSGSVEVVGASGGMLAPGEPVYGRFEEAPASHVWLVRGARDQRLAFSLARLEGSLAADLTLLAPDGTVLLEVAPDPGAAALTTEPVTFEDAGLYAVVVSAREGGSGLRYRLHAAPLDLAPEMATE